MLRLRLLADRCGRELMSCPSMSVSKFCVSNDSTTRICRWRPSRTSCQQNPRKQKWMRQCWNNSTFQNKETKSDGWNQFAKDNSEVLNNRIRNSRAIECGSGRPCDFETCWQALVYLELPDHRTSDAIMLQKVYRHKNLGWHSDNKFKLMHCDIALSCILAKQVQHPKL